MGKQYEMNIKVLSDIFKNKDILKNDIKKIHCSNTTEEKIFFVTYQLLRDFNIVLKDDKINPIYNKVFRLSKANKSLLINGLSSNFQEYKKEIDKFEESLKKKLINAYGEQYKDTYKDFVKYKNKLGLSNFDFINLLNFEINNILDNDKDIENSILKEYIDTLFENVVLRDFLININIEKDDFSNIQTTIDSIDVLLKKIVLKKDITYIDQVEYNYEKVYSKLSSNKYSEESNVTIKEKKTYLEDSFKEVLIKILQEDLVYIDNKDIYTIAEKVGANLYGHIDYINYDTKKNIVSIIIKTLFILGFIEANSKGNPKIVKDKTSNDYRYKLITLTTKEYKLSLAAKVETITNIMGSISNFKNRDAELTKQDIEHIKQLFDYV